MKKTFIEYFSEKVTPVKVVQKETSVLMRAIAWGLSILTKMKIVDFSRDRFMNDYITTIGSTIYVGGDRTMSQTTELHELCHVLQFLRVRMEIQYLVSKKWRSYYESSADQAWMIVWPKRATDSYIDRKVNSFVRYGIPRDMITEDLKKRRQEVEDHESQPEAERVAYCFIEWDNETSNAK